MTDQTERGLVRDRSAGLLVYDERGSSHSLSDKAGEPDHHCVPPPQRSPTSTVRSARTARRPTPRVQRKRAKDIVTFTCHSSPLSKGPMATTRPLLDPRFRCRISFFVELWTLCDVMHGVAWIFSSIGMVCSSCHLSIWMDNIHGAYCAMSIVCVCFCVPCLCRTSVSLSLSLCVCLRRYISRLSASPSLILRCPPCLYLIFCRRKCFTSALD
jgi:hypothetical protein